MATVPLKIPPFTNLLKSSRTGSPDGATLNLMVAVATSPALSLVAVASVPVAKV